jgi:ABC-type transport system involved in cytochrome bd biosynthesis fused ATPase/permease subunit
MFSSDNVLVMVLGIFTALGFIIGSTYFVYQMFAKSTKEILVRFILVIFTSLVALFIVDKTIAWKVSLIAPEQNEQLFELIRTLVLMIFSYYFGTKDSGKKNEED